MALKKFSFNVVEKNKHARCAQIKTHRGIINTPAFIGSPLKIRPMAKNPKNILIKVRIFGIK